MKVQYDNSEFSLEQVMEYLRSKANEQIKQIYLKHGAREPLFGITTKDLKPLAKKIKKNYDLAMSLYDTGNYDAMYFAGMIADPLRMSQEDFEHWMKQAYCQGISDYTVALTLAQAPFAYEVANRWLESELELHRSAGYSCYALLIASLPDEKLDVSKIKKMLLDIEQNIHLEANRVRYAMNSFVIACGISYLPLHTEALHCATKIGQVDVDMGATSCKTPHALHYIEKAEQSGKLVRKRKLGRCS